MLISNRLMILVLVFSIFFSFKVSEAMSSIQEKKVSLYNLYSSVLIYKYWSQSNAFLAMKPAYGLNKTWENKANWYLIYLSNGTVAFKNVDSPWICMASYGVDYRPISRPCNYDDSKQQFTLIPTSTLAVMIENRDAMTDYCLTQVNGSDNDSVRMERCPNRSDGKKIPLKYLWVMLPPLAEAKF